MFKVAISRLKVENVISIEFSALGVVGFGVQWSEGGDV